MSQEMPKQPFRDREEMEKTPLAEEMKAVLGIYELTRRLRAKNPENPKDVDKSPENTSESVGDHIAMTAYHMHYFLPLLEQQGVHLDYERVFDMVLAHDIGHISTLSSVPPIQRTPEQKRDEIINTAKIFGELPRRNGFNRDLFDAYAEYLRQGTTEARFVSAVNGLETMLYVLSRPPHLRKKLVAGRGYAIEDYRERIGTFCREFPSIREFYNRAVRLFHRDGYFAPSRMSNKIMMPEVMQNIFTQNAPDFGDSSDIDINDENERLLRLQRLKRKLRFEQAPKPQDDHHDTVAEHTSALLFINRYFLPPTKSELAQQQRTQSGLRRPINARALDSREGNETILAHDAPEAITSDVITLNKTEARAQEEWDAGVDIVYDYAPRAGGFNKIFEKRIERYEQDRERAPFIGNSWFVKGLDIFEAQLYIFDPETRDKLSNMRVMSRDEVHVKAEPILRLFPTLREHFDALEQKFREEGLP